ncbi:MAG: hypothetical protein V4719_07205 [Planctomycetota bacterium]
MASRREWGLPLFTKELQEQSARRRTYVIRVVYVAVFIYFALSSIQTTLSGVTTLSILGQGQRILNSLVSFQFLGIFLFLPALACDVLTLEKERNTLALLFLTRLGPWTIVIEKLLSRLFPMLMVLMCALPVMAFSYSLGGLNSFQLYAAAWYLFLSAFQTACIAVMCSALSSTTTAAFVKTYVVLYLLYVFSSQLVYLYMLPLQVIYSVSPSLAQWIDSTLGAREFSRYIIGRAWSPAEIYRVFVDLQFVGMGGAAGTTSQWWAATLLGIPSLLSGLVCLVVARWALYRKAFTPPSNILLRFFRGLDRIFAHANKKMAFDVKLVHESNTLPNDEPIAWREVSKRSLGQFRYLVRVMIPLLFPVVFLGAMVATSSVGEMRHGLNHGLSGLICFLWITSLALITVTAASTIPLERTRQTWDVLRSTPLLGREILTQKLRGVQRLQWVCSIPVLAAIGLQAWLRYQLQTGGDRGAVGAVLPGLSTLEYLIGAVGGVWLYSELARWLALWCGLHIRNSMRAVLVSCSLLAAFFFGPMVLIFGFAGGPSVGWLPSQTRPEVAILEAIICPGYFVALNEIAGIRDAAPFPISIFVLVVHLTLMGVLVTRLRGRILRRADRYLERIGTFQGDTREFVFVNVSDSPAADPASPLEASSAAGAAS